MLRTEIADVIGEKLSNEIDLDLLDDRFRSNPKLLPRTNGRIDWKCSKGHTWGATVGNRVHGQGCPYCSGSRAIVGETDISSTYPDVAREWDTTKNAGLDILSVKAGSSKKVWWVCGKGHSYDAIIAKRTIQGQGCPICSNRRIVAGINDLATVNPDLAAEFDSEKNDVLVSTLSIKSAAQVWWKCENGHSYKARVAKRAIGQGCKECQSLRLVKRSKKGKRSLLDARPDLVAEWDRTENAVLGKSIENVAADSRIKLGWKCSKGHKWFASASSRSRGSNCPVCAGRSVDESNRLSDALLAEFDVTKNTDVDPLTVPRGSRSVYWWKCKLDHSWRAEVNSRTMGGGCPVCSGKTILPGFNDLATKNPALLAEWSYAKNDVDPTTISVNSHKKVWWQCKNDPSHQWMAAPKTRNLMSVGCSKCQRSGSSLGELEMFEYIKGVCPDAENNNREVLDGLEIDVWIPSKRLGFEYNGSYWHDEDDEIRGAVVAERHLRKYMAASRARVVLVPIDDALWVGDKDRAKKVINDAINECDLG